jgi:hypothetical protein
MEDLKSYGSVGQAVIFLFVVMILMLQRCNTQPGGCASLQYCIAWLIKGDVVQK